MCLQKNVMQSSGINNKAGYFYFKQYIILKAEVPIEVIIT